MPKQIPQAPLDAIPERVLLKAVTPNAATEYHIHSYKDKNYIYYSSSMTPAKLYSTIPEVLPYVD